MAGTYYTVRALKRVKADGVERVPGDAGTQDFVVDTATRDLLVNLGIASLIGTASSAPTVSRPLTGQRCCDVLGGRCSYIGHQRNYQARHRYLEASRESDGPYRQLRNN